MNTMTRAPRLEDFNCSTCRAPKGEPCRSSREGKVRNGHARRQDKLIRAQAEWEVRESDRKAAGR